MPDLKVIIKEELEIDGTEQGGQFEKINTGIENIYKSYGYIPLGGSQTLYTTDNNTWVGSNLENDGLRYVRITNLVGGTTGSNTLYTSSNNAAATNSVSGASALRLELSSSGNGVSWQTLGPGDSFIITRHSSSYSASDHQWGLSATYFGKVDKVSAVAQGSGTSYHIFAAGIETT